MSANPQTGVVYDIRASLAKFANDLRESERMAVASAQKVRAATDAINTQAISSAIARAQQVNNQFVVDPARDAEYVRADHLKRENLDVLERSRFAATGSGASARASGVDGMLGAALKLSVILQAVRAGMSLIDAAGHSIAASTAEAAGNLKKAAEEAMKVDESLQGIPFGIGSLGVKISDWLTGDDTEKAKKTLEEAANIQLAAQERLKKHREDRAEGDRAYLEMSRESAAATVEGSERTQKEEENRHVAAIERIQLLEKEHKITTDQADTLIRAENFRGYKTQGRIDRERVEGYNKLENERELLKLQMESDRSGGRLGATPADQIRAQSSVERASLAETLRQKEAAAEKIGKDELSLQKEVTRESLKKFDIDAARRYYDAIRQMEIDKGLRVIETIDKARELRDRRENEERGQRGFDRDTAGIEQSARSMELRRLGLGSDAQREEIFARSRKDISELLDVKRTGAFGNRVDGMTREEEERRRQAIIERTRQELLDTQGAGVAKTTSASNLLFEGFGTPMNPITKLTKVNEDQLTELKKLNANGVGGNFQ